MRYAAKYYDGMTARSRSVTIAVIDWGVIISAPDGGELASWPADRVILAELPHEAAPVRLGLDGTTARLIVDDPGVVETLRPVAPHLYRRVQLSPGGLARIAVWAGAAAVSVALVLFVVVPSMSKQMAAATPETVKLRIGDATLRQLARLLPIDRGGRPWTRHAYCHGAPGREALRTLAVRITADMAEPPVLRLVVINTKVVNAFALPGNFVVLTKGFLHDAESPEEVAGVVAHELGHVALSHPIEGMYRAATVSALVSLIVGDAAGGVLITGLGRWALNSSYSRAAELEADRYAVERLKAAGIDSRGLEEFFARLLAEGATDGGALSGFLSTHPPTRERLDAVRAASRAPGEVFEGNQREWLRLRRICRVTRAAPPRLSAR